MRIVLDREKCTGHGRCYVIARLLVGDDERGYGAVIGDGTVPPQLSELARKAVLSCPEKAISVVE